jgi:hypothetical protein
MDLGRPNSEMACPEKVVFFAERVLNVGDSVDSVTKARGATW